MPLRELFAQDSHLVHNLWVQLFPAIWSKLSKEEQTKLTKPIVQLLAKVHKQIKEREEKREEKSEEEREEEGEETEIKKIEAGGPNCMQTGLSYEATRG